MDLQTIRTITIQANTTGVDQATDSLNKLATATDQVTTVSQKSSTATLSVQTAVDRYQKSLDASYRNQQSFSKAQDTLNKGLDQGVISQDRYNQLIGLAADKYNTTSGATKAFQTALGGVNSQIVALSAGAGPVGTFLAAFGPLGLAAAAGIGLVTSAYAALTEGAMKTGQAAIETRSFVLATGLAADQLSVLKRAAVDFGVSGDEVGTRLDKFALQIHSLNDATGPLYEVIRRVNPQIAAQMVAAHDTGTEIGLLAQAYQQATFAQRALIAESSFGRGSAVFGAAVLGSIADKGGLDAMTKSMGDLNGLTLEQINARAALTTKIEDNYKQAEKLKASIGADTVLQMMLKQSEAARTFAQALNDAANQQDRLTLAQSLIKAADPALRAAAFASSTGPAQFRSPRRSTPELTQLGDYPEGMGLNLRPETPFASASVPLPPPRPPLPSLTATINEFNAYASAMGAAVTPAEALKNKQDQLQKAFEDGVFATHNAATADADYARAQKSLKESFDVDAINRNMAALGAAKTPAEQYRQTVASLNLQLHDGKIQQDFWSRGVASAADAERMAISSGRERLGLLTDTEQRINANAEVQKAWADKVIKSSADETTAQQVLAKSIKDTSDRMQVLRSPLPGLTQLGLDAGNASKQIDTLATTSLNNLGNDITDVLTRTTDLSTGIKNMEQQFIRSLINMTVQMTLTAPIAQGLSSTLGGLASGSAGIGGMLSGAASGIGGMLSGVGTALAGVFGFHSGGIVGSEPSFSRIVHPVYFDDAPRFHSGGIAGDEIPIIAKKGEGVFTPGQMAAMGGSGGGGGTVNINSTYQITGGADAATLAIIRDSQAKAVQQAVAIVHASAPARSARYNSLGT